MLSTAALLLTLTVFHEAGNQPQQCQRYVADTVINRMRQSDKSAEYIIRERGQYQWLHHVRGRSLQQDYARLKSSHNPATTKEIKLAESIAVQALSKGYVPAFKGSYFQGKREPIPRWYRGVTRCGDLVFAKNGRK